MEDLAAVDPGDVIFLMLAFNPNTASRHSIHSRLCHSQDSVKKILGPTTCERKSSLLHTIDNAAFDHYEESRIAL